MPANVYANTAGTKLFYGTIGGGEPATQLAGIDSFGSMPSIEVDEFETTRVDQEDGTGVHDWYKQFAADHIDPGEMEIKLGMNETQLEALYGLVRQDRSWKILFSSGGKLIFPGYIKALGPEAQDKDEVLVNVTIRVTGKPVFTKAA